LVVQHIVFPALYRRLCAISRFGIVALVCAVVFWAIKTWGAMLPSVTWGIISGLTMVACLPLMVNRSPLAMELMWRARLKEDGEPGQAAWQVRLKAPEAVQNAALLWSWALGERVLVLGVARRGWCPQIFVLMPPWFSAGTLRRMRSLLRLGPPRVVSQVSGVS